MGLKKAIANICLTSFCKGPAKQATKLAGLPKPGKVLINYTQVTSIDWDYAKSLQNSKVPFSNKHRFSFTDST